MRTILVIGAIAVAALSTPASAQRIDQVIVFGDSTVDAGWYRQLSDPGYGPVYASYWASALAHGGGTPTSNPSPVKSQVLAQRFGLAANPANTPGGTNWATSSAKNKLINDNTTGGGRAAIPTATQISNYLSANNGIANPRGLYFINSGDNDITYASGEGGVPPPADPQAYMIQAANDLIASIVSIKNAGGRIFLISNSPYDFGSAAKKPLRKLYTDTLFGGLASAGVIFYRSDYNLMLNMIFESPSRYGFIAVSGINQTACIPPAGVTFAWAQLCSNQPGAPSTYREPDAAETRLWADDAHLAGKGQRIFGNFVYSVLTRSTGTHDISGDGRSDILWRDQQGNLQLWTMNGPVASTSQSLGVVPPAWSIVSTRSMNGDPAADILWRDGSGNLAVWLMEDPTNTARVELVGNVPPNWSIVGTGDFDRDNNGDILWRDDTGNLAIWLMTGGVPKAAGTARDPFAARSVTPLGNVPLSWSVVAVADANNDGKADILWRNDQGVVAIWIMDGAAVQNVIVVGSAPPSWTITATGDFDGNGVADLFWRHDSGDTVIWLMAENGQVADLRSLGVVAPSWSVANTGDYDGDRKSDVLWRHTGGQIAMWRMNGASVATVDLLGAVDPAWTIQGANAN